MLLSLTILLANQKTTTQTAVVAAVQTFSIQRYAESNMLLDKCVDALYNRHEEANSLYRERSTGGKPTGTFSLFILRPLYSARP